MAFKNVIRELKTYWLIILESIYYLVKQDLNYVKKRSTFFNVYLYV